MLSKIRAALAVLEDQEFNAGNGYANGEPNPCRAEMFGYCLDELVEEKASKEEFEKLLDAVLDSLTMDNLIELMYDLDLKEAESAYAYNNAMKEDGSEVEDFMYFRQHLECFVKGF